MSLACGALASCAAARLGMQLQHIAANAHTMTGFPGGLVRLQVVGTWLLPLVEMELRAFSLALTFHHGHASRFDELSYYIRSASSLLMFDRVPSHTKHHRFIAHAYPSYSTNKWIAQPYITSSPGPP